MAIEFVRLAYDELPLLHEWLSRPHVARWWGKPPTLDQVVAEYGPAIDGTDPTDLFAIVVDGRPGGMIQTYLLAETPEYAALLGVPLETAGLDLLLGEEDLLGRGIGTEAIRALVARHVFARPGTMACVADPEVGNHASIRAFEKAGFRPLRDFLDPEDGRLHTVMWIDR